jgi:hypothetical protein
MQCHSNFIKLKNILIKQNSCYVTVDNLLCLRYAECPESHSGDLGGFIFLTVILVHIKETIC